MATKTTKLTKQQEQKAWERAYDTKKLIEDAQGELRVKLDRSIHFDNMVPKIIQVNPDGTALVSTENMYCVIIHNSEYDAKGVESCDVYADFCDIDLALAYCRSWNVDRRHNCGYKKASYMEVLTYAEFYLRENGGRLPEKPAPATKRKVAKPVETSKRKPAGKQTKKLKIAG